MSTLRIASVADVLAFADTHRGGGWIYRGVSDADYPLVPKARRLGLECSVERHLFRAFCRELPAYGVEPAASEWQALALAQHHGVPTRLLDWTENPLVAAFFAVRGNANRDGAIYSLNTVSVYDDHVSPFELRRIAKFRPHHVTRRITAQRGLFTIHPASAGVLAVGDSRHKAYRVRYAVVSKAAKSKLVWDLSRISVNSRSLFPDLDNLATFLTWSYTTEDPSSSSKTEPS